MSLAETVRVVLEGRQKFCGTNCGNCKFFTGKKTENEPLNEFGGIDAPDEKHLQMAKKADLITLPGNDKPTESRKCEHKEVDMTVNDRMCCAYWDNPDAHREFK